MRPIAGRPGQSERWHPGSVGLIFRLAELLLILVPLAGAVWAALAAFRRGSRPRDVESAPVPIEVVARDTRTQEQAGLWRTISRTVERHDHTDTRWLDYELDAAKLLDFPLMTDVANPLVTRFHKAKLRADVLRPERAEDLLDDRETANAYLAAVEDYATAFDAAESEAMRVRRNDFSDDAQQRIARAQSLLRVADDATATPPERTRAYELAGRELDGLVVLPHRTRAGIERGIAGELDG